MQTSTSVDEVRHRVSAWQRHGDRVVLVPTMGNLHEGHVSLLDLGRTRGTRLVATIFVNPTQFGPSEDFARYPRTPERDARVLAEAGCDLLFLPGVEEMYPHGPASTRVDVPGLSSVLCGEFRPGHFEGVATVVNKLFNIVDPDVAIFGEKDFQQLAVIRRMVSDLRMRVAIVGAPTVREPDGLAMSSRNQYLSPEERRAAPALHRALQRAATALGDGTAPHAEVESAGRDALEAAGFRTEYFRVRDAETLQAPGAQTQALVVLAAARLGSTRLIDNVPVALPSAPL